MANVNFIEARVSGRCLEVNNWKISADKTDDGEERSGQVLILGLDGYVQLPVSCPSGTFEKEEIEGKDISLVVSIPMQKIAYGKEQKSKFVKI